MTELIAWIEALPISVFVRESNSVLAFPTFLFVHVFGMSIVAGGSTVVGLALLGCWPATPVKPLERLWPLIWIGFWINLVTGISLFFADIATKGPSPVFWIKMLLVAAGVVLLTRIRRIVFQGPEEGIQVPRNARLMTWGMLACWFGAVVAGRLLAYVATGR